MVWGCGLPKVTVSGSDDYGIPKDWDMMMAASVTYIEWQKMCGDRTKVNLNSMRQVRFVDKYGAHEWYRILDCKGVRELNSPSRHDGKYPLICNICDMKHVETRKVQGMNEHFAG